MSATQVEKSYYLELGGQEIEFTLVSNVWPGSKGSSPFCSIEKAYPEEPPEVEHGHVRGGDVFLTVEEFLQLAAEAGEKLDLDSLYEDALVLAAEKDEDAYWAAADNAYDCKMDR